MNEDYPTTDSVTIIQEQFSRIKLLSQDILGKEQKIQTLAAKVQELEENLNETQKQRELAEHQIRLMNDEHNAIFENQSRKSKQLQQFNQQLLITLKEVQDKNQQLLEKIYQQDQEIQAQQQGKVEIHQQLNILKQGVSEIEIDLQQSQKRNQQLKKEKVALMEELKSLQMDLEQNTQKDTKVNKLIQECERENQLLKQEIQDIKRMHEIQQSELAELRIIKKQYDELTRKFDDTVQQYNMNLIAHRKNDEVNIEKLNELGNIRQILEKKNKTLEQEKNNLNNKVVELNQQKQSIQMQAQVLMDYNFKKMNFISEHYIHQNTRRTGSYPQRQTTNSSVYDRLYDKSKQQKKNNQSANKKQDSLHKKQAIQNENSGLPNINLFEEFFNQLEQHLQDSLDFEKQLSQENVDMRQQMTDLLLASEGMKQQFDEMQNNYTISKKDYEAKHTDLIVRLEQEQREAWQNLSMQSIKLEETQRLLNQAQVQIESQEQIIIQLRQESNVLIETNNNLNFELENLKALFQQVQDDVEEMLQKKQSIQNKLCLMYGFVQLLYKLLVLNKFNEISNNKFQYLSNFVYYYSGVSVLLRQNFQQQQLKRYNIYAKFRKIRNAMKFIKTLQRECQKKKKFPSGNKILDKFVQQCQDIGVSFAQSDYIDSLVESYLPKFQIICNDNDDQIIIDHKLSQNLFLELINALNSNYSEPILYNTNSTKYIYEITQLDMKNIQQLKYQQTFYEHQLGALQQRVLSLDQFINSLQQEQQQSNMRQQEIQSENDKLKQQLKQVTQIHLQDNLSQNLSQEYKKNISQRTDYYEKEQFKQQQQLHLNEPLEVSKTLQQELIEIMQRKSGVLNTPLAYSQIQYVGDRSQQEERLINQP